MFSKSTKNFGLPQWQFGDHPAFMGDMNPAYVIIDELLKENRDAGDSAKERLDVLAPIVTANSQQISSQTSKIASLSVDLQNAEHAINDCKQNIAQNAADIAALQEEDHNIHETADADRTNFYKLLNFCKTAFPTKANAPIKDGTVTIGDSTLTITFVFSGRFVNYAISGRLNESLPSGTTKAVCTVEKADSEVAISGYGINNLAYAGTNPLGLKLIGPSGSDINLEITCEKAINVDQSVYWEGIAKWLSPSLSNAITIINGMEVSINE